MRRGIPVSPKTGLFVLTAMAVAVLLIAAAHLSQVLHAQGYHQAHAFAYVVVPILAICVLGYMAVHLEHQIRSQASQQAAAAIATQTTPPTPATEVAVPTPTILPRATSVLPWRGGVRRYGPVSTAIMAVFTSFVAICSFALIFVSHAAGAQTHRTQTQGLRSSATVLAVNRTRHSTRNGGVYYTSTVTVRLPSGATSTVHDPHWADVEPGQSADVLTDPNDPTYSEFPGEPDASRYTWIVAILVTLGAGTIAGTAIRRLRRMLRDRKTWRAPDPATAVLPG